MTKDAFWLYLAGLLPRARIDAHRLFIGSLTGNVIAVSRRRSALFLGPMAGRQLTMHLLQSDGDGAQLPPQVSLGGIHAVVEPMHATSGRREKIRSHLSFSSFTRQVPRLAGYDGSKATLH